MARIFESLPALTEPTLQETTIRYMEIYRFDCAYAERFLSRSLSSPNCGLLKISSSTASGYAEYTLPETREFADLVRWSSVFRHLKGLSLEEALRIVERQEWGALRCRLAASALMDLSLNFQQSHERKRLVSLPLERSFLMECSRAYFWF